MNSSKLIERLDFDIKFLLWRAEIHCLPAAEIKRRFTEIEQHYLSLSEPHIAEAIRSKLADLDASIKHLSQQQKRA